MHVSSYWVIDPDEMRLTAYELTDGHYREAASIAGAEAFEGVLPFAVRIVVQELLGRFAP